jgi:hypothetical protein
LLDDGATAAAGAQAGSTDQVIKNVSNEELDLKMPADLTKDVKHASPSVEIISNESAPIPAAQVIEQAESNSDDAIKNKIKQACLERMPSGSASMPASSQGENTSCTDEEIKSKVDRDSIEQISTGSAPMPASSQGEDISCTDEKIKSKVHKDRIEQISTGSAPMPVPAQEETSCTDEKIKSKVNRPHLEQMPSEPSPMPASSQEEDISEKKASAAAATQSPMLKNTTSNAAASAASIRLSNELSRHDDAIQPNTRQVEFTDSTRVHETPPNEATANNVSSIDIEAQRQTLVSSLGNTTVEPSSVLDASISVIPEAFLVEEDDDKEEVAFAELVPPWWKRKLFYAALIINLLIVIGVAVGVTKRKESLVLIANTTTAPSVSLAPSSSNMPSFQPSACVERSSLEPQSLEFVYFNLTQPLSAVNGGHAVVVDIHLEDRSSYLYVVFYQSKISGNWEKQQHFVEFLSAGNDTDADIDPWMYKFDSSWDSQYTLSMSKNTVLVGVPFLLNGGGVFVYEYSEKIKEWIKQYDSIVPDDGGKEGRRFGQSLAIDNGLAAVLAPGDESVYIFKREPSGWQQATIFAVPANTTDVVLSGSTLVTLSGNTVTTTADCEVVVFDYDLSSNSVQRQQSLVDEPSLSCPLMGKMAISENHLAIAMSHNNYISVSSGDGCWNPYTNRALALYPVYDIVLYYRPHPSTEFTRLQLLNSSDFGDGFGLNLALYEDFLLVGGALNKSNAFTFSNGNWEESLVLNSPNQCGADGYDDTVALSKRNALISTIDSVFISNVEECAMMPSSVPSEPPTSTPTTTCWWIELFVEHYHGNKPTWQFEKLNSTDGNDSSVEVESSIPTLRPTWSAWAVVGYDPYHLTSEEERKCLREGIYQFTIYNDPLFYNLTSNGNVIAEGREFGFKDSTTFQIPFE